ncbi:MAG TPA: M23 family metallopeptidase, partial [Blastocatellia bacterium]|nr:M23 family metallopeptidase [Blastocatellia bacterium]
ALVPQLRDYFYAHGGTDNQSGKWTFPLDGYGPRSIGGTSGSGYIIKGYDYFDGNKHAGHPAHDIFINDKNQDTLDDCTKKPVNVLSVSNGVVVARETEWQPDSDMRGGKYIFIYEPATNNLYYYAHNNLVLVEIGQIVKDGDVIAHVGRTGKSAYEKRSPTHLHFMYMTIDNGYPKALNPYNKLLTAETRPSGCK